MRTITTHLYQYEELNERAKENARDWYRSGGLYDDWYECIFEDFENACTILGIELRTRSVPLMGGGARQKPCIWFSGFCSQGDGACFEGYYSYKPKSRHNIRKEWPTCTELHDIADQLFEMQRHHRYTLAAHIGHTGRYYHQYSMTFDWWSECDSETDPQPFRDLASLLYSCLEKEHDYLMSDEAVEESIIANEYEFDENGKRI